MLMLLVILDQVFGLPGYAIARARLSTDQVVQINHGCNEWATYTEGVVLEPEGQLRARFVGGPFVEVPGYLLVEQNHQIGSDASGDPPINPTPARGLVSGVNGAIWVTRVVAIELATGTIEDRPGWDSFGAIPIPDAQGRPTDQIVFARGQTPVDYYPRDAREAASVHLWDISADRVRELATSEGPIEIVALDGRVVVKLDGEALEVSADGAVQSVELDAVPAKDPARLEARSLDPGDAVPLAWVSADGSPIEVREGRQLRAPALGYCGVEQALRLGDFVLVDDGLYAWPAHLSWPPTGP